MSIGDVNTRSLALACRKCDIKIVSPMAICQQCGPTNAALTRNSLSEEPGYSCCDCASPLVPDQLLTLMPTSCPDCGSRDLNWRDDISSVWSDQITLTEADQGPWVKARLDANYAGTLETHFDAAFGCRSYRLVMRETRAFDLCLVDAPALIEEGESEPLRFAQIGAVTVVCRDAEVGPERMYALTLYDARLHRWDHASVESSEVADALIGRLWGTVFARLKQAQQPSVQTILDSVIPPTPKDESAVQNSRVAVDERTATTTSVKTVKHTRSLANVTFDFVQRVQPEGFFTGSIWIWVFILSCVTLLVSRWPAVICLGAVFMLHRFLWRARLPQTKREPPLKRLAWLFPLLIVWFGYLITQYISGELAACRNVSNVWFFSLLPLLFSTALFRQRLAGLAVGALMLLLLILVFQRDARHCGQSLSQTMRNSVERLPAKLAAAGSSGDRDADIVAAQASGTNGRRISIDQALDDPQKYFKCAAASNALASAPYEIYFGESALFAFKQASLGPMSDIHLNKIAKLIETNPEASFVLTGHSDRIGAPLLNLRLSEQRAQSVADWLVNNGVTTREKIDVRGAGDRYPVVDEPAMYKLNRRVELHVDCAQTEGR